LPGHTSTCFIKGRFDVVVEFENKTYGVIDYKTGNPEARSSQLYGRQLHAYAYALEHAAPLGMHLSPITKICLLYFHPTAVTQSKENWLSFDSEITPIEIEKDEISFLGLINQILTILESSEPPAASPECGWCAYINKIGSRHTGS
jgi:CRISPR/Cas system-associated exonuclease Cas4 (RecB family)